MPHTKGTRTFVEAENMGKSAGCGMTRPARHAKGDSERSPVARAYVSWNERSSN